MKTYFRISDARNFKELQELISSTKAAVKSGQTVIVGGFPNYKVSVVISKPAESKTKKWGKLYTSLGNHWMMPVKAIKEKHMRSSIPVYIAVDAIQHNALKVQYESKHSEYSLALYNSRRDEFDDIDRTNSIDNDHGERIRNFYKTHPLSGFKSDIVKSHSLRDRTFNNVLIEDPKNAMSRIDAALADPMKSKADFWISHRDVIEAEGDMTPIF